MIFLAQPYTHHFEVGLQCAQSVSPDSTQGHACSVHACPQTTVVVLL